MITVEWQTKSKAFRESMKAKSVEAFLDSRLCRTKSRRLLGYSVVAEALSFHVAKL